jgi:uncharacterized OB-fold protein
MEVARHWRLNNQRYKMQGSVCACCGKVSFAPRPVCDACNQNQATYHFDESALRRQSADAVYATSK